MKRVLIVIMILLMAVLTACSGEDEVQQDTLSEQESEQNAENSTDTTMENAEENAEMEPITMRINDEEVEVSWEDNESVEALAEMASGSPLTIYASAYGGFEQVGPIGTALPSNDKNVRTDPGDIVLYSGSNIVVFYGSNSWSYTKLGHIENKSKDELQELLSTDEVKITLTTE